MVKTTAGAWAGGGGLAAVAIGGDQAGVPVVGVDDVGGEVGAGASASASAARESRTPWAGRVVRLADRRAWSR